MISDERNSNREVPLLRGHKSRACTALFQDLFGLQPHEPAFPSPFEPKMELHSESACFT